MARRPRLRRGLAAGSRREQAVPGGTGFRDSDSQTLLNENGQSQSAERIHFSAWRASNRGRTRGFLEVLLEAPDAVLEDREHEGLLASGLPRPLRWS